MELILKIASVGIVVAVICQVLSKAGKDDLAMLASLAGLIIVLL
ncbi:MAG: stage III sporulation protein AC, partial [Clostridia bacterium]|nr:stage III sporulation protein AC [Clostridia bacterium]